MGALCCGLECVDETAPADCRGVCVSASCYVPRRLASCLKAAVSPPKVSTGLRSLLAAVVNVRARFCAHGSAFQAVLFGENCERLFCML